MHGFKIDQYKLNGKRKNIGTLGFLDLMGKSMDRRKKGKKAVNKQGRMAKGSIDSISYGIMVSEEDFGLNGCVYVGSS